jgi:hypothetical protein
MNPNLSLPKIQSEVEKPYGPKAFLVILVPIFFCLHNLNEFLDLISVPGLLIVIPLWLLFPILIYYVARKFTGAGPNLSMTLSILLSVIFFFFGAVQDFLISHGMRFLSRSYILLGAGLLLVWSIFVVCRRKQIEPRRFINYSLTTLLVLVIWESVSITGSLAGSKTYSSTVDRFVVPVTLPPVAVSVRPDIYHIILDGYTSSMALRNFWSYDNPIDSFLVKAGFFVANGSKSNYNFSPFCIASTFDMQYLNGAAPFLGRDAKNFYVGRLALERNLLFKSLRERKYQIDTYSMLLTDSLLNQLAEIAPSQPLDWLRNQTIERLFLNIWVREKLKSLFFRTGLLPGSYLKSLRHLADYNEQALRHLRNVHNRQKRPGDGPVFSYVHFFLPHAPYLFDAQGQIHLEKPLLGKAGYLEQIKYTNTLIKDLVSTLLADSTRKKIIFIQGDHGYRDFDQLADPSDEFMNLNAVYFYNGNYKAFEGHCSPVNSFRVVFNEFFGANLALLADTIVTSNISSAH